MGWSKDKVFVFRYRGYDKKMLSGSFVRVEVPLVPFIILIKSCLPIKKTKRLNKNS